MPPELDNMEPEMNMDNQEGEVIGTHGDTDREGAMAKADLHKLATYATKLGEQIQDEDQLEAWVQAKITKAADYIASVYHYLEYEMKFTEYAHHLDNSDTLSESQRHALKSKLMEAKAKVKELKKTQAEKIKSKEEKIDESLMDPCGHCGGSGHVERQIPGHVKAKVEKHKKLHNFIDKKIKDANKNGIPDDEEVDEDFDALKKTGDKTKTAAGGIVTKTDKGIKHERPSSSYDDGGDELDSIAKSGKGTKSHAKAKDSATKKAEKSNDIKLPKHTGNTWGMKGGEKFGKKMEEGKEKKADKDYDGDGKVESGKDEYLGSRIAAAKKAGKLKEAVKMCKECDMPVTECSCKSVKESAKPSAGLSKAKKSATVKKAKAGGDIGKPGKSFDKLAKKAGGGEKGEKIAAAAMWKNIKETTAYIAEKAKAAKPDFLDMDKDGDKKEPMKKAVADKKKEAVKESTDFSRLQELTGRLNRAEKPALVENREVDQIRALTKRLLG